MPAKKTDWKAISRKLSGEGVFTPGPTPPPDEAKIREILANGTRSSEGNEGKFVPPKSIDDVLKALEANRKLRSVKKPYHPKLKGLFGGG